MDLLTRGAGFGYMGATITSLIYAGFTFIFFAEYLYSDLARAIHDMRIGQDIPAAGDDKAGTASIEFVYRLAVCSLRLNIVEYANHTGRNRVVDIRYGIAVIPRQRGQGRRNAIE